VDLSRRTLARHALAPEQFAGARRSTLDDGARLIHLYNAAGLCVDVLPDRGLDLWRASYRGLPLTWLSPNAPRRPDAGAHWLDLFNGGLLTTCGLRHAGPAEEDDRTGETRSLHGGYTNLAAGDVDAGGAWNGDAYLVRVRGRTVESRLFGPQIELVREITLPHDAPVLEVRDEVTNLGDEPQPLMLLHHVNLGYPLVREGARLSLAAGATVPRDEVALSGAERWDVYEAAQPRWAEQVFFHAVASDADGWSRLVAGTDDLALELSWDARSAPYVTQWKNTREGIYVSGVEPGNCLPEGQNRARAAGRLDTLEPGACRTFRLRFRVLAGAPVSEARDAVLRLRAGGRWAGVDLHGYPDTT